MELTAKPETHKTWGHSFKKKVLTDRQLWKAKFSAGILLCYLSVCLVLDRVMAQLETSGTFSWKG
jgi:hypothetical protein